jgi:hypothetical protein
VADFFQVGSATLAPRFIVSKLLSPMMLERFGGLKPDLAKEFNVDIKKRYRKTTSWLCR